MSPLVWDLAHIGNQEEQWLLRDVGGRARCARTSTPSTTPSNTPARDRPSLPLLAPDEARGYVADVRGRVLDILDRTPLHGAPLLDAGFAFGMIAQHEQQHDETMLATHQLRPGPAVLTAPEPPPPADDVLAGRSPRPRRPVHHGHRHRALGAGQRAARAPRWMPAFVIDTAPVSNGAYQRFIEAGGYQDPRWWAAEGWAHVQEDALSAPLFWQRTATSGCAGGSA